MPNETILNRQVRQEGENVISTKTVEEILTRSDVLQRLENVKRNKEMLLSQSNEIKRNYDELVVEEQQLNEMLALLPEEQPTTIT